MKRPAFLEAFNAKAMTPIEVAKTFVPSSRFEELAGPWNAILVGPRGSGKTTLLKMLSIACQMAWTGPIANNYQQSIGYAGIYVPTDIAWAEMVKALNQGGLSIEIAELISEAAFVTSALLATVNTMGLRLNLHAIDPTHRLAVHLESKKLESLVDSLSRLWKLSVESVSLEAVEEALRVRLLEIKSQSRFLEAGGIAQVDEVQRLMPYLALPLLDAVGLAVSRFNSAAGTQGDQWCLLLDELEVAPLHLQRQVLTGLRAGGQQELLVKVALVPCGPQVIDELGEQNVATSINDFRLVELWYADKGDAIDFCEQVFISRTQHIHWLSGKKPKEVFGTSAYAIVDENGDQTFAKRDTSSRTRQWEKDFESLFDKDETFKNYIEHKKIDPSHLDASPSSIHGNTIRKIASLVAFRKAYRSKTEGKKRGVKPYNAAYCGWEAIAAISEGNPRWLIGMINSMIAETDLAKLPVPVHAQTTHVQATSDAFVEMLESVATEQNEKVISPIPTFESLRSIGDYFHRRMVTDKFVEDPPLSFTVDKKVPKNVESALRIALNNGGIVCYEGMAGIGGFRSLLGKRFRLTYLLSPWFKLPIRKSKSIDLSTILREQALPLANNTKQASLWDN